MSDSDLEARLAMQAADFLREQDIRRLIGVIWQLDRSDEAARVMALTVPTR